MDHENTVSRLGHCEVCSVQLAKYTCPECEVKTCSLPCVKIHKKELQCSGIRNKVKFKPLTKFNNLDFQSDYIFLEEATRSTDTIRKCGKQLRNMTYYSLPRMKIRGAANKRNIGLYYLPKNFSRHKSNSTYYDWKKDKLFWKVEWVFPEAEKVSLVDTRVPENETLEETLEKYLNPSKCDTNIKKILAPYHNVDIDKIEVLLKGEKSPNKKFFLMDKKDTLMENLSYKKIIEHPIFYIVFASSLEQYPIEREEKSSKKSFSNNFKGMNLLFSNGDIKKEQNSDELCI